MGCEWVVMCERVQAEGMSRRVFFSTFLDREKKGRREVKDREKGRERDLESSAQCQRDCWSETERTA